MIIRSFCDISRATAIFQSSKLGVGFELRLCIPMAVAGFGMGNNVSLWDVVPPGVQASL